MIKVRLTRKGAKNNPFYRIVASNSRSKRGGESLETVGYWHPSSGNLKIDREKLNLWLKKGAGQTNAVKNLVTKIKNI